MQRSTLACVENNRRTLPHTADVCAHEDNRTRRCRLSRVYIWDSNHGNWFVWTLRRPLPSLSWHIRSTISGTETNYSQRQSHTHTHTRIRLLHCHCAEYTRRKIIIVIATIRVRNLAFTTVKRQKTFVRYRWKHFAFEFQTYINRWQSSVLFLSLSDRLSRLYHDDSFSPNKLFKWTK